MVSSGSGPSWPPLGSPGSTDPERWMRQALREAEEAAAEDEVPVGCVAVFEGRIIGRGHNRVEALQDPTAHAEILALTAASATLGSWRLPGVHVYVTVEPCVMCAGAMLLARIEAVWFGACEPKFGACGSRVDLSSVEGLNHRLRVVGGVLEAEVADLMRGFFRAKRARDET
jgi:tRNA(adenine34) deaminase